VNDKQSGARFFNEREPMSKDNKPAPRSKSSNPKPDVVQTILRGQRISEMTAGELIQTMKRITKELDRRNRDSH
jgi:hypothetical protein